MTTKDYKALAAALGTAYAQAQSHPGAIGGVNLATNAVADALKKDNPRFDEGSFYAAVNIVAGDRLVVKPDPLAGTQLEKWRQARVAPPAVEGEHIIEFVFRAAVGPGFDPDDIQGGSQLLFEDTGDSEYAIYIPEGSHWRCVGIDPAAADLPGGNRLEAGT